MRTIIAATMQYFQPNSLAAILTAVTEADQPPKHKLTTHRFRPQCDSDSASSHSLSLIFPSPLTLPDWPRQSFSTQFMRRVGVGSRPVACPRWGRAGRGRLAAEVLKGLSAPCARQRTKRCLRRFLAACCGRTRVRTCVAGMSDMGDWAEREPYLSLMVQGSQSVGTLPLAEFDTWVHRRERHAA